MTDWNDKTNTSFKCREEFETWAKSNGFEVVRMMSMDAYFASRTDRAWNDWQKHWVPGYEPTRTTEEV